MEKGWKMHRSILDLLLLGYSLEVMILEKPFYSKINTNLTSVLQIITATMCYVWISIIILFILLKKKQNKTKKKNSLGHKFGNFT